MHLCLVLAALVRTRRRCGLGAFGAHGLTTIPRTCGLGCTLTTASRYLSGAQRPGGRSSPSQPRSVSRLIESAAGFFSLGLGFSVGGLYLLVAPGRAGSARRRHAGRWFGDRARMADSGGSGLARGLGTA